MDAPLLLADLARTSEALAATPSRTGKAALLAELLARAGPDDAGLVVGYLSGSLRQRRTGLGPAALRDLPPPAVEPTLTIGEVDAVFERIASDAGAGSARRRLGALHGLMARAGAAEQHLLAGLVVGEVRHGALGGVMLDAVARAAGVPLADVRRAAMLGGSLVLVAQAALADGVAGLDRFRLEVGRPLQPMLAQAAESVAAALERTGPARVEEKLDGVRVQVHRDHDGAVRVFTRSLDDVTGRLGEVEAAVRALDVRSVVLDGEALALGPDGRALPFQETASRVGTAPGETAPVTALAVAFFDVLHLDGQDLVGESAAVRWRALERAVPEPLRVRAVEPSSAADAEAFLAAAIARGQEGVLVKSLAAPYEAGRRGGAWVKVKPRHTLDLVVLAAEWGHGRRRGVLSNLHLGARDRDGFVMLGKTFKGLTDAMLAWQTEHLLALQTATEGHVVRVRPELVVEVAFDGVQTSPRYPAGMALRFARVLRHRPDKPATEADTVEAVREVHTWGHRGKASGPVTVAGDGT